MRDRRLRRRLPFLSWAEDYSLSLLKFDFIAGLTVGVVLVPQGVAYAMLAELPPVYGLYGPLAGLMVYALFGTSRHLAVGPFALVSLLVAETVSSVVPPEQTAAYVPAVMLLSLMVGVLHLLMALLRLDIIIAFLSEPVLNGFTSASAVLIASSQLKHLLGLPVPRGTLPTMLGFIAMHLHQVNLVALAFGIGGVLVLDGLKRLNKRFCPSLPLPEQLFALVLAGAIGAQLAPEQVHMVGHVPSGLPTFEPPPLTDLDLVRRLLQPAATVGLFAYILAMSIVRTMAIKYEYSTDANQELVAFGIANIIGSFFSAFPAAGSLSRTSLIASTCGAHCTPLHGMFTAAVVLIVLVALTPAFRTLPYAVLASIVFMSVKSLFDLKTPRALYKLNPPDFWLWLITFTSTLLLGTQSGIVLSIVCSLIALVAASMRPPHSLLGRLPGTHFYCCSHRHPAAKQHEGVAIFRFVSALHFANKDYFHDSVVEAVAEAARLQSIARAVEDGESTGHKQGPTSPGIENGLTTPEAPTGLQVDSKVKELMRKYGTTRENEHGPRTPESEHGTTAPENSSAMGKQAAHDDTPDGERDEEAAEQRIDMYPQVGRIYVLVLDFSSVTSIDSTSLRMLLEVRKELTERSIDMVVCGIEGQMKELLIRAKFFEGTCDKIFADLHTACKAAVALANEQSGSPRPTLSKSDSNPRWQALSTGNLWARQGHSTGLTPTLL